MPEKNTYILAAMPVPRGAPVNLAARWYTRAALLAVEERLSRHQLADIGDPETERLTFWTTMAEWVQLNIAKLESQSEGERAHAG